MTSESTRKPHDSGTFKSQAAAPLLRIGITGHRRHRLMVSDAVLAKRMTGAIEWLCRATKRTRTDEVEIISALAEGADAIAAQVALEKGYRLSVLLPFKLKDYEKTFTDPHYVKVFRKLIAGADHRVALSGSLKDANEGYRAVGEGTLDQSNVVLGVWDGAPAQGTGGTPEILQSALRRRLPIIWIDARVDSQPHLIVRSRHGPCPRINNVAQKAKPLSRISLRSAELNWN